MLLVAEGVTRGGVLETNAGNDVAGGAAVAVDALVGVHLEDAAKALAAVLDGVVDIATGVGVTRVHAQVGELAHVGVGHDLEGQGREGLLGVSVTDGLVALEVGAHNLLNVQRAGQVVDNGVQKLLDALVLVGRAHKDRVDVAGEDALAQGGLDLLDGGLLLHEQQLHKLVVIVGDGVKELLATLSDDVGVLRRNLVELLGVNHALGVLLEVPCLHGNEVDEAPELRLRAHGDLRRDGVGAKALLHGLDGVEEVGADAVILVDERDARNVVVGSLTPNGLGLRLDASNGVEHGHGTVEDAKATLDLGRKVNVARGVDDLDDVIAPEARGGSGRNGYAALLLLDHPVHGRRSVVHLTDLVGLARVVEDALGSGGLTSVNMGHDADIAQVFKLVLNFRHKQLLPNSISSDSGRRRGWPRPS